MFGKREIKVPPELALITSEQFFKQPEIAAITDRLAASELERRKVLVAALAVENGPKVEAKCAALAKAFADSDIAVTEAQAALDVRKSAKEAARHRYYLESGRTQMQRQLLSRQLVETADFRLGMYISALEDLFERARHATFTAMHVDPGATDEQVRAADVKFAEKASNADLLRARIDGWVNHGFTKGERRLVGNSENVVEILRMVRETQEAARVAQLEALTSEGVLGRLTGWNERLLRPLAALGLQPPAIADACPRFAA